MKHYSRLSRIFFPEKCDRCHRIIPLTYDACPRCGENVSLIGEDICCSCGYEKTNCFCDSEINPHLSHITAVYYYSGAIREKIHAMKFRGRLSFTSAFAKDMAKRVRQVYPEAEFDLVCSVPMTRADEKKRGYNQTRLLAKELAYNLSVPFSDCLIKIRSTDKQHTLTGQERLNNLKGSFSVSNLDEIRDKTVLLCDDIKTTGATLSECEKALLSAGAKDVYCICIALADYKGGKI